jgi:tyrosine-protein phosphatase
VSPVQQPADEDEQNFDIPLSKEEKPEAYPDGPICVYEPFIDLYLEPNAKQCRQYDVVLNVASEVQNPLIEQPACISEEPEIRIDGGGGIQYAPKRDRMPAQTDETSSSSHHDGSPTTPKATSSSNGGLVGQSMPLRKEPEYIHIMWEHNSDIVPDLLRLVKLIDEKFMEGKRILVHCQCGVSRSASLVVAYGLYKDPTLSVQEAYDAVKKRSKWIGPNMNLIMQLQEFRTSLHRGGLLAADRGQSPLTPSSALSEWGGPFSSILSQGPPSSAGIGAGTSSQTSNAVPNLTSGPSSAKSAFEWPLKPSSPPSGQRARAISAVKPGSAYVNASGRVVPVVPVLNVPVLNVVEPDAPTSRTSRPQDATFDTSHDSDSATPTGLSSVSRAEEFAMTPLQPSPDVDPADSFGLMSPTSTEFASSPFDRSMLLAQLGMGPVNPDDRPRRSASLKSKSPPDQRNGDSLAARPQRLRGKISSPTLREQEQLQSLQARIEASLPRRTAPPPTFEGIDEALMSPRATEFTQNPFALSLSIPAAAPQDDAPRTTDSDPRSPATKGVSPIVRNILDVL